MPPSLSSPPEKTTFRLEVQPETPISQWHATLHPEHSQHPESPWHHDAPPLEFDSPLDLARHLANLGLEHGIRAPSTRRGLR